MRSFSHIKRVLLGLAFSLVASGAFAACPTGWTGFGVCGAAGTAAFANTGTSNHAVPFLDGNNTESGSLTFSGTQNFTGTFEVAGVTVTFPTSGLLVGTTDTQTLTNKTISGASNTLSNIGNGSLINSSMTLAGHVVSLGGTQTFACGDLSNSGNGCSGTLPVGANPSGTAGPLAVNGSANTFMRSDAAPPVQKGTNAQFGIVEGDGSTITCTAGVCTAIGGSATSVTAGTTTVSGTCPSGDNLYNNSGTLGCQANGGGASLTTQDLLGNSVASTTSLTAGLGFTVSGSAGSATFTEAQITVHAADSNYTLASTDQTVCFSTTFTASRTATMLATTSYTAGQRIIVADCGAVNGSNALLIAPNGTDTINGVNGSVQIKNAFGAYIFEKQATGKWIAISANIVPAFSPVSHQFLTGIDATGTWSSAQPAFTDLSGSASVAQIGASAASHAVPVDVAGTSTYKVIPDCQDTGGNHINYTQSTDAFSCGTSGGGGGSTVIRNSLGGCTPSNGATPNSELVIAPCMAADTTVAAEMSTSASFFGSTGGAWASGAGSSGSPVNKMGNGLTIAASTWYHVCMANNGGTPDFWFDTSASCANRPSGISDTKFRLVDHFETDASSHILPYTCASARDCVWNAVTTQINGSESTGTITQAADVPPGQSMRAHLGFFISGGVVGDRFALIDPAQTTAGTVAAAIYTTTIGSGADVWAGTNTSQQIKIVFNAATTANLIMQTIGWSEPGLGVDH